MTDPFRKVSTGDPLQIPAIGYNAMLDAAIAHKATRVGQPSSSPESSKPVVSMLIKNTSGSDLPIGSALGISGPAVEPANNEQPFLFHPAVIGEAITPANVAKYTGNFAVLTQPARDGAFARCALSGVVSARINVVDVLDAYADVQADETVLQSSPTGGAAIVWKEDGLGEKLAMLLVSPKSAHATIWAKITGSTSIGGDRWTYEWEETRMDGLNPSPTTATRTHLTHGVAINSAEIFNTGSGVQGNGVDAANLTGSFETKPIRGNPVVLLRGPFMDSLGTPRWMIQSVNAVDGACP